MKTASLTAFAAALFSAALTLTVSAQTAPATPPAAGGNKPPEEAIQLNVFTVSADRDDSYGALNSNSITRFNTELAKLPISADIYNEAFMRDINATNVEDMISQYTAGAGFASNDAAASSDASQPGERQANASIRLRGLTAPAMLRDAFMSLQTYSNTGSTSTGVTTNFDLERTEVIMGPQSLLYGSGGGGGVINLVSKQARFNKRLNGRFGFRTDNFGSKIETLDLDWGGSKFAARAAFIDQHQNTRRVNIGNDLKGQYVQLAWQPFESTVIRLSGTQTWNFRTYGTNLSVNATNATNDARHNQFLRYLLATNQLDAPASGPSRGPIANGGVNWGNVDSWFGDSRSERTIDTIGMLTVETKLSRNITTQLALGYKDFYNQLFTESTSALLAPGTANNTTGVWAVGATGTGLQRNIQPGRAFPARLSVAFDNSLFSDRVRAQSIVGVDYLRMRNAFINYNYFLADANFNPVVNGPATSANNGRTNLPAVVWPMVDRPTMHPITGWSPGQEQFVFQGRNYLLMQSNPANVFPKTEDNPHGVTPGGSNYNIDNARNKGVFGVTDITSMNGKLHTLLGFRYAEYYVRRDSQGTAITAFNTDSGAIKINDDKFLNYSVGANYALREWLRPYFSISDSYSQPAGANNDPMGATLKSAHAVGGEVGVKVQNPTGTISGSLALYAANAKNEAITVTSTVSFYINPSGLNGRAGGAPSVWMNADRKAKGIQAAVTASPTRNWRMRFSAALTDAETSSSQSYPQVYNDQFYANSQGQVTYKNGQVVYVPAAFSSTNLTVASTTAGAMPLTIAMLSTQGSPYYTSPQPITGAITVNSNGGRVLAANNALTQQNGPILTGATGLPISQIQINPGFAPPNEIPVTKAGEASTNVSPLAFNFTSIYTFSEGFLRGFRAGGSAFVSWKNRRYYYYPAGVTVTGERNLFSLPTQTRLDAIFGYDFRIRSRYTLGVQLNIRNITNHYKVIITPNAVTGWAGPNNAIFSGEPRSWELSTTLGF